MNLSEESPILPEACRFLSHPQSWKHTSACHVNSLCLMSSKSQQQENIAVTTDRSVDKFSEIVVKLFFWTRFVDTILPQFSLYDIDDGNDHNKLEQTEEAEV